MKWKRGKREETAIGGRLGLFIQTWMPRSDNTLKNSNQSSKKNKRKGGGCQLVAAGKKVWGPLRDFQKGIRRENQLMEGGMRGERNGGASSCKENRLY